MSISALHRNCPSTRQNWRFISHQVGCGQPASHCLATSHILSLPLPQLIYLTLTPVFVTQLPGHFAHGSDRHMIRLEDIFQKFPRIPAIVEIKEKNEELIHKVVLKPGR